MALLSSGVPLEAINAAAEGMPAPVIEGARGGGERGRSCCPYDHGLIKGAITP